ncbi:MAG: hypothetical protein EU547_04665 [Promethearchaeota archaeon]|nr:MAG: hypothetical protein EU547_04665 [Candidatus Lokiarchaeota archaeon]
MRPPICAICGKESMEPDDIGLVSFAKTESNKKWEKKSKKKGFVGHPPWQEWFCKDHIKEAKKLTHLSLGEAMEKLNKKFNTEKS